ncbi:hypothetical protein IV203_032822 [Nitzschia inconspicua]|uniref:Uncharacterized protein n=1 Tax=Nitzschia inconspicua TaxID=303405 RepID=A0A9K3KL08_9STRA|nr:hypothetical protein IV203_032822 [Nitzschia inconspicua]
MESEKIVATLTTKAFELALAAYIDENKPDPIAKRQLESWRLHWENIDAETAEWRDLFGEGDACNTFFDGNQNLTHQLQGNLTIQSEYLSVQLQFCCAWSRFVDKDPSSLLSVSSNSTKVSNNGMLLYSCRVHSAELCEHPKNTDDDNKTNRKIRQKIIKRLQQDSYIAKLLTMNNTTNQQQRQKPSSLVDSVLAKARIHVDDSKFVLEERVDVSETIAEALRRALWSSTESSLDMIEVLLALPSLPGTQHNSNSSTQSSSMSFTATTPLANRAKLRLLEDAMLDECEKEGEGELIQELSIVENGKDAIKQTGKANDSNQQKRH